MTQALNISLNSLGHLNTDYIDRLLIHRPDPLMNAEKTGRTLDDLVKSGKVKTVGVSNFQAEDWRLLQDNMNEKLVVNQLEMNLLHKDVFIDGTLSSLQRDGMKVMAWSPLAGGGLFSENAVTERLKPIFERLCNAYECGIDHIALAWLLAHPATIMPVVGTNNLERIKNLNKCFDVQLDRETWYELWTAANGHEVP